MSITEKIAEHPYVTGGIIVAGGLVFILAHNAKGQPTAVQVTGAAQPNPNVQIAGIQAGAAQQAQNAQFRDLVQTQNYQLSAQTQQLQASLAAKQLDFQTAQSGQQVQQTVALTQLGNERFANANATSIQAAAIAAQIEALKTQVGAATAQQFNALQAQQNIAQITSNTQIKLNEQNATTQQLQIGTQAAVAQSQIEAALKAQQLAAASNLAISNNQTQAYLGGLALNAATTINGQNVAGNVATTISNNNTSVANNYITTSGQISAAAIAAQAAQNQSILNLIQSGQLNKGGEGGANQVSVLGAVTGYPGIGGPAQNTAAVGSSQPAQIIKGIGSIIATLFG